MNKITKLSILTLASALFSGMLLQVSPTNVAAYDDFIVEFHKKTILKAEVGDNFSIILTSDYQVYTFGINDLGQLGNGTTTNSNVPINITARFNLPSGETIKDIDAGSNHAVALTNLNRIFAWGANHRSQLGVLSTSVIDFTSLSPLDVTQYLNPNVSGSRPSVLKIEASNVNTLVLRDTTNTESLMMIGDNLSLQIASTSTSYFNYINKVNLGLFNTVGEKVIDAGIYDKTSYALSSTGRVATWGSDASGQLGNGGSNTDSATPGLLSFTGVNSPERVISVATGTSHSVAVTNFGSVFFWGSNAGYAIGEALPLNDSKTTPHNLTSYYATVPENDSYPIFGPDPWEENTYWLPFAVEAGYRSTFFKVSRATKIAPSTTFTFEDWYEFYAVGTNTFGNVKGILAWTDREFLLKPYYISYNYYDEADHASISFSMTNLFILNTEGDFTMYGSNIFGQQGLGFNSENVFNDDVYDESNYNHNFSYNVRDFENYVYAYLPANLTAPLNDYFDQPNRQDEYDAIFGNWYNEYNRQNGIIDYYFGEEFTDKEWLLISDEQMLKMRSIFAEIFEDQVLYGWVPATNAELLTYVQDNLEERYWLREDMEAMANYQSWELSWDDLVTLDQDIVDLLPAAVETRLVEFRAILAKIQTFEDDVLQPFVEELNTLDSVDADYLYLDEDGEFWLDLGGFEIEQLITLGYTDDILAIFEAYDELSELEQLLLMERHDNNYYELYYEYYEYFADQYADLLADFESEVQEFDWENYRPLFENLSDLEALLAGINTLNPISLEFFENFYVDGDENYYDYYEYEYWIWLNELLPLLQEGKDVFNQIVIIEDLIQNDDDYDYVNLDDVQAILDMYADFLLLSEEAQDLLDPEYVYSIYSLALEALAYEVEDLGWDIDDIEDESGTYGLFANYDDVLAALAKFEALPEDALEYLSEDAIEYYEYLMSIKLSLEEGLDVFNQIMDIEDMDLDNLDVTTIEAILDMYEDYLALSEDAQDLLDPEYVEWLLSLIIEQVESDIETLPGTVEDFDALFNDAETKDATINGLLGAWNKYQAMSDELRDDMDPEARAHLEALYARYLELTKPSVDLLMIGLILVHLSAGVYFAFKKKDVLVKPVQ